LLILYLPLFIDSPPVTKPELKSMLVGERLNDGGNMYLDVADNTGPLAAWFHGFLDMIFGKSLLARHILAFIIIFLQSGYLGIIFITKKVFSENTFIPSFLYCILFFFSFDTLALSDELLGLTFLLLALSNLFQEIEFRMQRDETTFNLGFFVSIASLFYLPYITFLFGILVILFLFARTDGRKFLLVIFGFLLPHLFVLALSYLNGSMENIWKYYYLSSLTFNKELLVSARGILMLGLIPLFYFAVSLVMLNRLARFSKYQSQLLQSIFLWVGFGFIYFLFCRDFRPQTTIVLIPAFTFLFTHFLLLIRRKKFAEMNTWIMLIGIVTISYLARYNRLGSVNFQNLFVTAPEVSSGGTIFVLEDRISYYSKNKPATPFINWKLARETFEHPEYYESITDVYSAFTNELPDRIVDKDNLLPPFFERMPDVKKRYRKKGIMYEKIAANN
jgi:hypothetical protein